MIQTSGPSLAEQLVTSVVNGIQDVKGEDIVVLDLREIPHAVADFFVVCHGNSTTQVSAIARGVEKGTRADLGQRPWQAEGYGQAQWVLLDYSDVVVHVFYREARAFYGLEELWADAERQEIEYAT